MFAQLDPYLLAAVDAFHNHWPRPRPSAAQLQAARVISHRGERSAAGVIENSLAAFDPLRGKVWGLECDVRFSRDGVPMVFHDADLLRLFGVRERLCDLDQAQLAQRFPQIPSLAQLAQRYGGQLHMMLEFKAEPRPDTGKRLQAVQQALQPWQAGRDFHLMSLDIATLEWLGAAWPQGRVAIARHNVMQMSRYALQAQLSGMTGHYMLLRRKIMARHNAAEQWCGLGFPASQQCLRHCLNQGASYLFSNHALALQAALDREKSASKA